MHHFKYRKDNLYCESVDIQRLAERIGTPFYLYSYQTLIDHYKKIEKAFVNARPLICFSMKSNSSLAVCRVLVKAGAGLDIVSGGELFKALKVGADPKKIVYASVGKTADEIENALNRGILFFNVESLPELNVLERLCAKRNKRANVAIRLNPAVRAQTHHYIMTGSQQNKFGIDLETSRLIFRHKAEFRHLDIIGLHIHIGSQIIESAPFIEAIKRASAFIKELRREGHRIEYLNIGGGLGIIYHDEKPQTADEFAKAVMPLIKNLGVRLILEPGRFISGNSGILVTRVLYVKKSPAKHFIIVDAGMNDLIRPSLYGAYHEVLPVVKSKGRVKHIFDVVGPICESADFIARERVMPAVEAGELLAVMGAGAYGFSMSSNYNARPRTAEIMVRADKYYISRRRESYEDLIRGEKIPDFLK